MLKELKKIFTEEYQKEMEFIEFKRKMAPRIRVVNEGESVDIKIQRLIDNNISFN